MDCAPAVVALGSASSQLAIHTSTAKA